MQFRNWLNAVDARLFDLVGMGKDDLPGVMYWDMWDAGESVEDMVRYVLAEACDSIGIDSSRLFDELKGK